MTDQFLLATNQDYSGSYTDRIIFDGTVLKHNNYNASASPTMYGPLADGTSLGFWSLDGDILDSSGNGRDLAGVGIWDRLDYVEGPIAGTQGLYFSGSTLLSQSASELVFADTNKEMTVEFMMRPLADRGAGTSYYGDYPLICMQTGSTVDGDDDQMLIPWMIRVEPISWPYGGKGMTGALFMDPEIYEDQPERWFGTIPTDEYPPSGDVIDQSGTVTKSTTKGMPLVRLRRFTGGSMEIGDLAERKASQYAYMNGVWQHCVFTSKFENSAYTTKLYINGQMLASSSQQPVSGTHQTWGKDTTMYVGGPIEAPYAGNPVTSPVPVTFRSEGGFDGTLSHIHVASRPLTEEEIKERYQSVFKIESTKKLYLGSKAQSAGRTAASNGDNGAGWFIDLTYGTSITASRPEATNLDLGRFSEEHNYHDWFHSDILPYVSGSANGRNHGFVRNHDSSETWYDSLVPSPAEYHVANGAELILVQNKTKSILGRGLAAGSSFALGVIGKAAESSFIGATAGAGVQSNTYVSAGVELKAGDTSWQNYFPFEQRYSHFNRLKQPSKILDKSYTVRVSDSSSLMPVPWSFVNDIGPSTLSPSDGVLNTPVESNIFSGFIFKASRELITKPAPNNPNAAGIITDKISVATDLMHSDIDGIFQGNYDGQYDYELQNKDMIMEPGLADSYKLYFGTGRKYGFSPWAPGTGHGQYAETIRIEAGPEFRTSDGPSYNFGGAPHAYLPKPLIGIGVRVAGWKYGLKSAIPFKNSAVYRRDKFGQFRDMLEQKSYTRFLGHAQQRGQTEGLSRGVVEIRFVTDSPAAVTASNPTLNTEDSGIYQKFYTSGRPYSDSR